MNRLFQNFNWVQKKSENKHTRRYLQEKGRLKTIQRAITFARKFRLHSRTIINSNSSTVSYIFTIIRSNNLQLLHHVL